MAPFAFSIKEEGKDSGSAAKVMGTVFWDAKRLILAEFLEPGQTITAARYVQTLHKLCRALRDKHPGRNIIILHDNARPPPLASHRKQLQRWGGKFFHTSPIALIWHPPTTIFSDL